MRPLNYRMTALFTMLTLVTGCAARVIGEGDGAIEAGRADVRLSSDAADTGPDVQFRDVPVPYDVFREDVCVPEGGRGMTSYECDPFNPTRDCAAGTACYPFIEYPSVPCGQEIYRATCVPAGTIPVDGFCTGGERCAPGLTCFVTGSGNRCLHLCRIDGSEPLCPRGQICQATDLPDFGACD